jgi:hypothetical protein
MSELFNQAKALLNNSDPAATAAALLAHIEAMREFTNELAIHYDNMWELQMRREQS